jgi:glyoxylase-like metal-dependent hydrolase (beta-lactamase superfamily II)
VAAGSHGGSRLCSTSIGADWLPVYAFAIEHRDGAILVDSGSNAGLMSLPRWRPYFRFAVRFEIEREQESGPQLRALGIAPRDVKTIVPTHMHIDHDGGLEDFASSAAARLGERTLRPVR